MPTSAQLGIRYPASGDSPDIPRDLGYIAADLEANVKYHTTRSVLDVGVVGQTRAGRVLTVADFTDIGITNPVGLFNLGDLTNLGSGGALVNKGAVPFGTGVLGAATEAAIFAGSTAQALYVVDTGAADPFRIKTGSFGCWFRTAKRGTAQALMGKWTSVARSFTMQLGASNVLITSVSTDGAGGTDVSVGGNSDVCDDRWHFAVGTYDGTMIRLYVDGTLESSLSHTSPGLIYSGVAPFNIGAVGADASVAAVNPHYGRVDEAFVTPDVLSEEQVRNLYAVKLTGAPSRPARRAAVSVYRERKGATLITANFSTTPLRLYNLAAVGGTGLYTNDDGSDNADLTANVGTGVIESAVAGPDGNLSGAIHMSGAHTGMSATDTGLPSATASRSYGCWFKTTTLSGVAIIAWGNSVGVNDVRLLIEPTTGKLQSTNDGDIITSSGIVNDGAWHFAVVTEENAPVDGLKRKLYLDGHLIGTSTTIFSTTLGGANKFRIGANQNGTGPFNGQIARAFVTGYILTPEEILKVYARGGGLPGLSPIPAGEIVERINSTDVLVIADQLESQYRFDIEVSA